MSDIETTPKKAIETTPKKAIETTPKKQSCLEWSFKRGNEGGAEEGAEEGAEKAAEEGADPGSEQWAPCTPSPFKKVRSFSSEGHWKAFTEELEATRLRRVAEAKDRGY